MPTPQHRNRLGRFTTTLAILGMALVGSSAIAQGALASKKVPGFKVISTNRGMENDKRHFLFLTPVTFPNPLAPSAEMFPIRPVSGSAIVNLQGKVIWYRPAPGNQEETINFQVQKYKGKPVLTWWQGIGFGRPFGSGEDLIYSLSGKKIASVKAGNGFPTNGHEFLLTNRNTALVQAVRLNKVNLTSIGGPSNQTVAEESLQEIDLKTGAVLFDWRPADHVPYTDTYVPLPPSPEQPWDWFHANAFHIDKDGNFLINSRNTWTIYKVDRANGGLIWKLGGKSSTLKLQAGPGESLNSANLLFAWQHDPVAVGPNEYTVYADEGGFPKLRPASQAEVIKVDPATSTATLVNSYKQPKGQVAHFEGSVQRLPNGNLNVGWGALQNCCTIFSESGEVLFNARFTDEKVSTYRSFLQTLSPKQLEELGSSTWSRMK
jgi:hypothetical protein